MMEPLLTGFGAGLLQLALLRLMVERLSRLRGGGTCVSLCFGGRMLLTVLIFCGWCQPDLPAAALGWWLARCAVVRL